MSNAPEGAVNKHIKNTRSSLEKTLKEKLPYGTKIAVRLVGAEGLYDMIMQEPDFDGLMRFTRSPIREDKRNSQAFLGLVTIKQYVEFLRRKGTKILRDEFFSANVRAYGGDTRAVNAAIKGTLSSNTQSAFWWMNNGITILADEATEPKNDTWRLKNPQIVKGLQTSHVLHETELQGAITAQRLRETILVRIITEKDPDIREAIITGTNNQTNVSSTQLYANDEVQLRLEKYLKTKGWYYERRRWQYRNTGTPSSKIKNITELAQLMMSIHLLSPDFARARPGNILKSREGYKKIFPEGVSEELYVKALNIGEAVETYLRSDSAVEISFDPLNDRFYIVSGYILRHMGIKTLEDYDAFRFVRQVNDKPTNEQLEEVHNLLYGVVGRFSSADAKDKIFKGSELKNRFFEKILDENVR